MYEQESVLSVLFQIRDELRRLNARLYQPVPIDYVRIAGLDITAASAKAAVFFPQPVSHPAGSKG